MYVATTEGQHRAARKTVRRLRRIPMWLIGGLVPIGIAGYVFPVAWLLLVVWFVAYFVAAIALNLYRCPACRQYAFIKSSWPYAGWYRRCRHCGLDLK